MVFNNNNKHYIFFTRKYNDKEKNKLSFNKYIHVIGHLYYSNTIINFAHDVTQVKWRLYTNALPRQCAGAYKTMHPQTKW